MLILFNLYTLIIKGDINGYEVSIYTTYSILFWIFVILSAWLGIICIGFSYNDHSNVWIYGLMAIFCSHAIVFFLPAIRGYFFFANTGYDFFAHLAWIQYILTSGHLETYVIYPATHILTAIVHLFGLDLGIMSINFLSYYFYLIYLLSFIILGKEITGTFSGSLMFVFFAFPLIFSFIHQAFMPYGFALFMIPLFMYLLHKKTVNKNSVEFNILLILVSVSIVFFHPLILLTILIILCTFHIYFSFIFKRSVAIKSKVNFKNLILILIVALLVWYMNFSQFLDTTHRLVYSIFTPENVIIGQQTENLAISNSGLFEICTIFMKMYGSLFLYLFLASFFLLLLFKKTYSKNRCKTFSLYSLVFVTTLFFAVLQFFLFSVINEPVRVLSVPTVFATILSGISFNYLMEKESSVKSKKIIAIFTIGVVFLSSALGLASIYDSPWKGTTGSHMTKMYSNGLSWYLENNNNSIPLLTNIKSLSKYELYYSQFNSQPLQRSYLMKDEIPSHFGYTEHLLFVSNFDHSMIYLITDESMKYLQSSVFKSEKERYPTYLNSDFERLNQDRSVSKYYTNGEFIVWKVGS